MDAEWGSVGKLQSQLTAIGVMSLGAAVGIAGNVGFLDYRGIAWTRNGVE